jgi:hypothetical protein
MKNPYKVSAQINKAKFSEADKSKGIADDFAVRKVVNSIEGTIEKAPSENNDIINRIYLSNIKQIVTLLTQTALPIFSYPIRFCSEGVPTCTLQAGGDELLMTGNGGLVVTKIRPNEDIVGTLGSSVHRWANLFTQLITISGQEGISTVVSLSGATLIFTGGILTAVS